MVSKSNIFYLTSISLIGFGATIYFFKGFNWSLPILGLLTILSFANIAAMFGLFYKLIQKSKGLETKNISTALILKISALVLSLYILTQVPVHYAPYFILMFFIHLFMVSKIYRTKFS